MIEIEIENEVTPNQELKEEIPEFHEDGEIAASQQNQKGPRHRLEVKNRSYLENIREGPYITHNVMITHAEFLKSTNKDKSLRVFRISPTGGGYNYCGDIFALITWYFLVVFIIAVIPLACYCENSMLNIANAIILTIILMYHLVAVYAVTKNCKKFRRAWYITDTPVDKYMGLQNYFVDVTIDNVLNINFLNSGQKQKIVTMLAERQTRSMVLMLCTKSYWKNRVTAPVICLSVTAVLSLIGIFVQIVTLR